MEQNVVELGGRGFVRAQNTTVAHDVWLMGKVRAARLDEIEYDPAKVSEVVDGLIDRCFESGQVLTLLSGLLLPAGMEPRQWTPAVAQDIEKHLSTLTDKSDKAQIAPLLASMLIFFFQSGISSLRTSRKSSTASPASPGDDEAGDDATSPQPTEAGV